MTINFHSLGVIRTPYSGASETPYQPLAQAEEGAFYLDLDARFQAGLRALDSFRYITVLYYIDRLQRPVSMEVRPGWAPGTCVGLFASRSPLRPNPIGLSVTRLLRIEGHRVYTSGLDVFDGTPLLDIKPYIDGLDSKTDANAGWVDALPDSEHLMLHIKGLPHEY